MLNAILFLHIMAGLLALGMAGTALATSKGSVWHRRAGRAYVLSMLVVTLSTLALVVIRPNLFLLVIGIFSFYLVFTGWRAAILRDGRPRWQDHGAGAVMAGTGLFMMAYGLAGLWGGGNAQPVILVVFGTIGVTMAVSDWAEWRSGPVIGKARIVRHLTRMLAGTIATITAAVVVNISFLPALVTWLGPTALITPLIFWWTARVRREAVPG